MHIAESREETEFVGEGLGPFADALRARGIAVDPRGLSPIQYLRQLAVLPSCLCIHCVQVNREDIALLASEGASVAHCPRSNRAHAHGVAPLADFRSAGVRVGLGTDSVVSTGDVNLWEDAIAAGLSGEDALRMLTLEGARALGMESRNRFVGNRETGRPGCVRDGHTRPPARPPARPFCHASPAVSSTARLVPMKTQRHTAILKIIRHARVASQEQLRELLRAEGFDVTQATLSRDIRELGTGEGRGAGWRIALRRSPRERADGAAAISSSCSRRCSSRWTASARSSS